MENYYYEIMRDNRMLYHHRKSVDFILNIFKAKNT